MKRMLAGLVCLLVVAMPAMAGDRGGYGHFRPGFGHGHYDRGVVYRVDHHGGGVSWGTAGAVLAGLLLVDAVIDRPSYERVVYVPPAPVYQRVVYVQPPPPQVVYIQPPPPAPVQLAVEQPRREEAPPEVEVIKIPITLKNGASVDIRIIRANGTFIGPQGEVYRELPTSKTLTEKYGG